MHRRGNQRNIYRFITGNNISRQMLSANIHCTVIIAAIHCFTGSISAQIHPRLTVQVIKETTWLMSPTNKSYFMLFCVTTQVYLPGKVCPSSQEPARSTEALLVILHRLIQQHFASLSPPWHDWSHRNQRNKQLTSLLCSGAPPDAAWWAPGNEISLLFFFLFSFPQKKKTHI